MNEYFQFFSKLTKKIEFLFQVCSKNLLMSNQTIDTVYVIIHLLEMIDKDNTIHVKEKHPLIDAVVYLADEHLTGNENFKNIVTVREAGFDVYAGEQDRFGWLVGCIELKRGGVIVFG